MFSPDAIIGLIATSLIIFAYELLRKLDIDYRAKDHAALHHDLFLGSLPAGVDTASRSSGYPFPVPDVLVGARPEPQTARFAFGRTCLTARLCRSRWSLLPAHPRGKNGAQFRAGDAPVTAQFFIHAPPSTSRDQSRSARAPTSLRSARLPPCRRAVRRCRPPAQARRN